MVWVGDDRGALALAVGNLEARDLGPRCRVYAEPETVEKAAWEFAETESMIASAEKLFGPYEWDRFDMLIMPPAFPYGGMENPRLTFLTPTLLAGDRLLVSGTIGQLKEYEAVLGATLHTESDAVVDGKKTDLQLAEVAVTLSGPLHRRKLGDIPWAERYGLQVLALHDASGVLMRDSPRLQDHRLQASDVLLVQGTGEDITRLKVSGEMLVLDGTTRLPRTRKAPLALSIMLLIVLFPALGLLPIEVSALAGVMAMVATRCLGWRDATRALSAQVILIIVVSLALGSALMKTGGADWLARLFLAVSHGAPAALVLASLMLLMAIVTNVVSNNAAAVIGTPVAISIAMELGQPLEPFVLAVLFGANLSFVTPMAYKTNLLVMNAGGYRFGDFVRVGTPLTIIMWLALTVILALSYDL